MDSDPALPVFTPDRRDAGMEYRGLHCLCGEVVFRISGWPRVISGKGGFFWRTLARVWREARMATEDGEPIESPFWLPLFTRCRRCDTEEAILDGDSEIGHMPLARRREPRESYRCRACRRSEVELVVGSTGGLRLDGGLSEHAAVEVVARCHRCRRQARVAFFDGRPSSRQVRLDLLYGRR